MVLGMCLSLLRYGARLYRNISVNTFTKLHNKECTLIRRYNQMIFSWHGKATLIPYRHLSIKLSIMQSALRTYQTTIYYPSSTMPKWKLCVSAKEIELNNRIYTLNNYYKKQIGPFCRHHNKMASKGQKTTISLDLRMI